ncbi:glycine--tRNA ligase [Actinocatenispora sera]|uniref:glycine--tRNA ligase n=1 Tax=Actinocatenispora sera TaxID=390989 RepID=UPI0033CB27C8
MQDALLALQRYWTDRGCMIMQPFNTEVGAGTMNPATILRVLGPEPWHVAYVEPSVRPDDSRYGENPNRLQTHTQFQVILKPDPGDPVEVYLGSLEALGIDIRAHDVRFVEDNWAAPALGAWGLGWEVWLDGLEITQFTYFQQAGGKPVEPVSVEITYGIERILMALQNVGHFKDIAYSDGISYGEVFGQSEYEMSRYYLDDADVATNQELFEAYATEARRMLDARLPVPAHNYVLKCSHTFNVLDSRGAISTTERARAFARMRGLAREVSALWAERREELGYPLGVAAPPAPAVRGELPAVSGPATVLFEIGVEELPPHEVTQQVAAVRVAVTDKLAATRLAHGEIRVEGTPRRLAVLIDAVADTEPDAQRTLRGPKVAAAFDADGNPTKAAAGFARGRGVEVADLERIDVDGVEHVGVTVTDTGRPAAEVLSDLFASVVAELRADKNMRWRDEGLSFTRPVRWLTALYGETPIPVAVSSLSAGRTTRIRRTAPTPVIDVPAAQSYVDTLAGHGIVLAAADRRAQIVRRAQQLAAEVGGTIDVEGEAALIDEVTNLVEEPNPLLGNFDPKYLDLPSEILTTVMRKHQRYLPVRAADGTLLPHFVAVANGPIDVDAVRAGNEAVLRARYEDAAFFWRADLAVAPADMKGGLDKLTFADKLGSMADRAERIAATATDLADLVGLTGGTAATVRRAGELAKFDLASSMVIELSSLAGTMAREYARRAGEPDTVAAALYEMELPRGSSALPTTVGGAVLALADRFDLLTGLSAVGEKATGSSDPFGLRRAAVGVVSILRAFPQLSAITLTAGLRAAAAHAPVQVTDEVLAELHDFLVKRYAQQLADAGHDHRHVEAVLPLADAPAHADATLAEVGKLAGDEGFEALAQALGRVRRIVPADTAAGYDAAALVEPAEIALAEATAEVTEALPANPGLAGFVPVATALTGPINTFFDDVLVMAKEPELRAARLGLLATIRDLAAPILDWSAL